MHVALLSSNIYPFISESAHKQKREELYYIPNCIEKSLKIVIYSRGLFSPRAQILYIECVRQQVPHKNRFQNHTKIILI